MKYKFHPDALEEYREAAIWYANRGCLTYLFPYAILYTIEDNFILIVAVMHFSREPGYWRERIRKP